MNEKWRPIDGFESSHEVSNLGRIRTIEREWVGVTPRGHPARRKTAQRVCGQRVSRNGYMQVALCVGGKPHSKLVHRIVAHAFIPPAHNCEQVNHVNGDKTDNRVENLEWTTARGNQLHAIANGLARGRRGMEHGMSKLTDSDVREIRRLLARGVVQRRIAEQFGVAPCKITMIKHGTAWKHVE